MLLRFITLLSIIGIINIDTHSQVFPSEGKKIDIQLGDKFDKIEGYTIDGKFVDDTYFDGKISLVNITIDQCKYCVQEVKYLNKMRKILNSEDFNIISIYAMQNKEYKDFFEIAKPKSDNPLKLSHSIYTIPYYDNISAFSAMKEDSIKCDEFIKNYGCEGYPVTLILDGNMNVRHKIVGFNTKKYICDSVSNSWIEIMNELMVEK